MAKKRTMNELRQTKEYKLDPVKQIMAQQIDEDLEAAKQMAEIDYQEELDKAAAEGSKEFWPEDYQEWADKANSSEEMKQNRCPLDPVEEAKILIVDKITKHFQDVMFEMVNEEMSKNYLFQSQNYLTEAGYELFEDEYFEFYHTHHGDILYEVMQNITN